MLRTPTTPSAFYKFALTISLATCLPFLAKADLDVTIVTSQNGNQVTADVLVSNFTDILSAQFALQFDPAELQFVSVDNFSLSTEPNFPYFGITQTGQGHVLFAWMAPGAVDGESLPDCSTLFRLSFNSVNGQAPPVAINGALMLIEVYNAQLQEVQLNPNGNCMNMARITGNIFRDENLDCTSDEGDANLSDWWVKITRDGNIFFSATDIDGYYYITCSAGLYEVSILQGEEGDWSACQPSNSFQLVENQVVVQDFAVQSPDTTNNNPSGLRHVNAPSFLVKITPNPVISSQPVLIETKSETARTLMLQIFDTSGKLLRSWQQEAQPGTSNFAVQPSLEKGLYLLKITDETGEGVSVKLVVY